MKIKVSKILLESALIFQAKNDVRYYLNGVCFKADGRVCSTDGHRAFIGGKHDSELTEDVILKITKSPTNKYHHAIADTENGIVEYLDSLDLRVGVGLCEVVDGRFPDIDRIIPKQKSPTDVIGFNAKYLVDVEKVAKLFNPKYESVKFEMNGNHNSAAAKLTSYNGETAIIIVMPMRID